MRSMAPVWKRMLFGVLLLTAVMALMLGGTALAATPQDIYNDFAADGDLDGSYTQDELNAVLDDPFLAQYGNPQVLEDLKNLIQGRESFPFTGAEIALILGSGVALLVVGLVLRSRRRET